MPVSYYLKKVFNNKQKNLVISKIVRCLKKVDFNAIAISGYSMSLISPIVATKLNKQIVVVRKMDETCHSYNRVEGFVGRKKKYVIIDDCVSSGNTIKHITTYLCDHQCVGVYLYGFVSAADIQKLNDLDIKLLK
jgi:orotate phosphoribosyltransferase